MNLKSRLTRICLLGSLALASIGAKEMGDDLQWRLDAARKEFGEIQFASGSGRVDQETSACLLKAIDSLLHAFPGSVVQLVGHTDSRGPADLNRRLSLQRAETVRMLLVEAYGVSPGRLKAIGRGEDEPLQGQEIRRQAAVLNLGSWTMNRDIRTEAEDAQGGNNAK